ncbi:MAG: tetratricopeptide repeat protein [Candidatus Puniceispirillaceae bacterium]
MIFAVRSRLAAMLLAIIVLAIIVLPAPSLLADQTDARLPALFTKLRTTSEAEKAKIVAAEIWQIWSEHSDNDRLSERLKIGIAQMEAGRLRQAEQIFTTIIDTDPAFAEAWNKRATVYFLMGAYDRSKRDIAQTILREPRHFGALSGLGLVETHLGNYEAALNAYEQAIALHPYLENYEEITTALKKLVAGEAI